MKSEFQKLADEFVAVFGTRLFFFAFGAFVGGGGDFMQVFNSLRALAGF